MALHTFSILPGFPELRGRRTRLRAPRDEDRDALQGVVADPVAYLAECAEFLAQGGRIDWIVTTTRDDTAIGTCTLHGIDLRERTAWIGYALHPGHRGRGFATDAAARVIRWAVDALGIETLLAHVDADNLPSKAVLRRLAFEEREAMLWRWRPRETDQSRFTSTGST